ncbi:MAG: glycoside hydrolase family 2 protein, partial [Polaribacter sp.]
LFYFEKPKNLKLIKPTITSKISQNTIGEYLVELQTDVLVKNVYLQTSIQGNFSNNSFDMLPSQKYLLHFET